MIRFTVACAVCVCAATASGQQWAEKMFAERSVDFGAVPRSAKVEHEFVITNLYKEDVHIAGVRTSCGCTAPRILKDTLKTHEKGVIVAAFNTRAFSGQHRARITVTIDRPQWAEVELNVTGYVRTDITLEPGQIDLGSVPAGKTADKKIRIEHRGRDDWQLTGVTAHSPYLVPTLKEISRSGGHQIYELEVQLTDGAAAGYLNDELILTTNDRRSQFPVIVEGRIVAALSVSPTTLMLGTLSPGQEVNKQIVVKGVEPFSILDVRCDDDCFAFNIAAAQEKKKVHLVPVTFIAGEGLGKITRKIEIITDLRGQPTAELTAIGHISTSLASR